MMAVLTPGSDRRTIVTGYHLPDGIVVDVEARNIYWTDMGVAILRRAGARPLSQPPPRNGREIQMVTAAVQLGGSGVTAIS
jgi:hypothetical protein